MRSFEFYANGREATWVKHYILEKYLERLAYKVGSWCKTFNYVDGFAGPWRSRDEELSDTSPHIAINQLRAARDVLLQHGSSPTIRCLFIEKDPAAVARLENSLQSISEVEFRVLPGEFEEHIDDVLNFASLGQKPFSFFFIDPTGWTGFGMKVIGRVLRHQPGEVLINFMTKDIKRFIDDPTSTALPTFVDLFGRPDYRDEWRGLSGQDREDAIVSAYCEQIKRVGEFNYVVSAVVLHPNNSRTHFHLIYASRHPEGLRVFREVEAKTMVEQERIRAAAQQDRRVEHTGQLDLFAASEVGSGKHYQELRERYRVRAQASVRQLLATRGVIDFDELDEMALTYPMTWLADLKQWLKDWEREGLVRFEGLAPRARIPQRDHHHRIIWLGHKEP